MKQWGHFFCAVVWMMSAPHARAVDHNLTEDVLRESAYSSIAIPDRGVTVYLYAANQKEEVCRDLGFVCTTDDGSQTWVEGDYDLVVVKNGEVVSSTSAGGQNYATHGHGKKSWAINLLKPPSTNDILVAVPSVGAGVRTIYYNFYRLKDELSMTRVRLLFRDGKEWDRFFLDGSKWDRFASYEPQFKKDGTIESCDPGYDNMTDEEQLARLPAKLKKEGVLCLTYRYNNGNFYAVLPKQTKE